MATYSNNSSKNNCRVSCFFCLRSNSRKYFNTEQSDFCENVEEAVSSFHEFSLRNLYRYLNLLHSDKEERDFKHLKMPICEDCFRVNEEFNKLYDLLEVTKLRLNWCIKKMQDVMSMSKSATEQVRGFEEDNNNDDEMILEIWRSHTFNRMEFITSASLPRVALWKAGKRKCPSSHFESVCDEKTIKMGRTETFGDEEEIGQGRNEDECMKKEDRSSSLREMNMFPGNDRLEIKMSCEVENVMLSGESTSPEIKVDTHSRNYINSPYMSSFVPISSTGTVRSRVRCKSCKKVLSRNWALTHWKHHCLSGLQRPKISKKIRHSMKCTYCSFVCVAFSHGRGSSMERHQVRFHPEHFLLNANERDLASGFRPDRFRRILNRMTLVKFFKSSGRHTSCCLCEMKYKGGKLNSNIASVRQHLILQHKNELKEDLNITFQDPLLDEKLNSTGTARNEISRREVPTAKLISSNNCTYCSFTCRHAKRGSMTRHIVRFHPEHYLLDESERDQTTGFIPQLFRRILTQVVYPKFMKSTGCYKSCSLCGVNYKASTISKNVVSFQKHLVFHHNSELKEAVRIALEDPTWKEKLDGSHSHDKKHLNPRTQSAHWNYRNKSKMKRSTKCLYCSFVCHIRWSMERHQMRFHSEYFILDENERDQASGFQRERFRRILNDIVFPKLFRRKGRHLSCCLCEMIYKCNELSQNIVSIRKHLIGLHKTQLRETLSIVLNDPLLNEEGFNLNIASTSPSTSGNESESLKQPIPGIRTKSSIQKGCTYCGFKCIKTHSMTRHHVRFHPEHYLIDEEDKKSGLWHEQFRRILVEMVFPKFVLNTGRHRSCSLCGIKYQSNTTHDNVSAVRRHLLVHHKMELKDNFKVILDDPLLEEKLQAVTAKNSKHHVSEEGGTNPKYSRKCNYCRFKCDSHKNLKNSMERHLARFHPEHFLIEGGNDESFRHLQFQRILAEIVLPKYIMDTGVHANCSLCELKYTNTTTRKGRTNVVARMHIFQKHKTEFKESVRIALEDPMLEEKLGSCNSSGVTCACGVYFPQVDKIKPIHDKLHCIRNAQANSTEQKEKVSSKQDEIEKVS